ncbi:hypothetical protein TIFTF001_011633 [Ficus carica]|uniref:Uncharacterized protein n=1 Tax=Ficus carica TaxID=3494 RepID=A0AA88D5J7_FICCA|nr:hypothetical protein TIFTF001_011633 [Ficus carica]
MAGTPGNDSQNQFLALIHNFATEKSQGERRIVGLKKRVEELRSEAEVANAELEDAKRSKEIAEQELKGYEVELALSETSIQSLKSRIFLIQEEISTVGSDLEALKFLASYRLYFIETLSGYLPRCCFYKVHRAYRKFQETFSCNVHKGCSLDTLAEEGHKLAGEEPNGVALSALEDMMAHVISQTTTEEEEYLEEQNIQKQVTQKELIDRERNVSLIEVILKTLQELQDLSKYPY